MSDLVFGIFSKGSGLMKYFWGRVLLLQQRGYLAVVEPILTQVLASAARVTV
jgi:hypothetical protein